LRYEPLEHRRLLALVTVDTLDDTIDLNDGRTSLREAIFATNLVSGPDTIEFSPALTAGGPSTILLTQGELAVTDHLTISGPGAALLTVDASGNDPTPELENGDGSNVFFLSRATPGARHVSISGLSVTGADHSAAIFSHEILSVIDCVITHNGGSGISSGAERLNVTGTTISENSGRGINCSNSIATIIDSIISNNSIDGHGGGILSVFSLTIVGSTISGNSAGEEGGGIWVAGFVTITDSVISDNVAADAGGGIFTYGSLTVHGSTISGNSATGSFASGGGIYGDRYSIVTVRTSTITGNSAEGQGGAAYFRDSGFSLSDSIVTGNSARGGGVIALDFGSGSDRCVVTNCVISENLTSGIQNSSGGTFVRGSTISDNAGDGIDSSSFVSVIDSSIENNAGTGIRSGDGLSMTQSVVAGNSGGGIVVYGTANISDSKISHNSAVGFGGGINSSGPLSISHSLIRNNSATLEGGGIALSAFPHNVSISNTTISGNSSALGGGISNRGSVLSLFNSTISNNQTTGNGGGLVSRNAALKIINSTVSGNRASGSAGGLYLIGTASTVFSVDHCTIAFNDAGGLGGGTFVVSGNLKLNHTILAANTAPVAPDLASFPTAATEVRSNLIGTNLDSALIEAPVGSPDANGNLVGGPVHGRIDPRLSALTNNGGPTFTHALLDDSPAHDAGEPGAQPGADQRGVPFVRTIGDATDIGAVEQQDFGIPMTFVVDTLADENDGDYSAGDLSLREAVGLANGSADLSDTIEFAPGLTADGPAKILLTLDELPINDDLAIRGPAAELLSIDASGNDPTPDINDGNGSRVFNVDDHSSEVIDVSIERVTLSGGDTSSSGGAILSVEDLTVVDSTISGNATNALSMAGGGGIASPNARLTVDRSRLVGNFARSRGGAIFSYGTALTISDSEIEGNTASYGGGVYIKGGNAEFLRATVSGNSLPRFPSNQRAAGVDAVSASLAIANSTIAGNLLGGGLRATGGSEIVVENSMIINNQARGLVIFLPAGSVNLTSNQIEGNHGGGIDVRATVGSVTISNSLIRRNGSPEFLNSTGGGINAFVSSGATLLIQDLELTDNQANARGGGINVEVRDGGSAMLRDLHVRDNIVGVGGGRNGINPFADAGGIAISSSSNAVIVDCTVVGNHATRFGGGIDFNGIGTIERTKVEENTAGGAGGGIRAAATSFGPGIVSIVDCEVLNNSADRGGGIYLNQSTQSPHTVLRTLVSGNSAVGNQENNQSYSGHGGGVLMITPANVVQSVIEKNTAKNSGGGIYTTSNSENLIDQSAIINNTAVSGGGIFARRTTIRQSTVSGNTASIGAGVLTRIATNVEHSTITRNQPGPAGVGGGIFVNDGDLTLSHSIVASNGGNNGDINLLTGATIESHFSLIGHSLGSGLVPAPVGSPDANGNLIGTATFSGIISPRLGPLADHGGPTPSHALLPDSPALNAGDPAAMSGVDGVPEFDQRVEPFTRVHGGRIDIGAFEWQPNPLPGDFNFDGAVDTADYAIWRKTRHSTIDLRADGNADGVVDEQDLVVWRSNFGKSFETSATDAGRDSVAMDSLKPGEIDTDLAMNFEGSAESAGMIDEPVLVTTLLDVVDFNDGVTSLREAIFAANLISGPHTIEFSPALMAGGPPTIQADLEVWRANFGREYAVRSSREVGRHEWNDCVDDVFQLLGSGAILRV
jgi:CSLREA domain-containing protein